MILILMIVIVILFLLFLFLLLLFGAVGALVLVPCTLLIAAPFSSSTGLQGSGGGSHQE
jgi:hypothetical protein